MFLNPGLGLLFILMILVWPAGAQSHQDSLRIYTEPPRLFLGPHRLKLLQKERERRSLRWQQFELLMAGHAPMPEPGFASALYYRVAGDTASGRAAVTWALGPGTDLRQLTLVFDVCQALLAPAQSRALAAKLAKGLEQARQDHSIAALRSRTLAAVALADHLREVSERELESAIQVHWRGEIAPELQQGHDVIPHEDYYAL